MVLTTRAHAPAFDRVLGLATTASALRLGRMTVVGWWQVLDRVVIAAATVLALTATATAGIDALSGASQSVNASWSPNAYQKPCSLPPTDSTYSRAAQADPRNWIIRFDWGNALADGRHFAAARTELRLAHNMNPKLILPAGLDRIAR